MNAVQQATRPAPSPALSVLVAGQVHEQARVEMDKTRRVLAGDGDPATLLHALSRGAAPPPATVNPSPAGVAGTAGQPAPTTGVLDEPVGHQAWEKSMARQVLDLAGRGEQRATLRLNPASLGALDVHIATGEGEARVHFSSQHMLVRDAVESALPRLREMFQGSGVNLAEVEVSRHGFGTHQGEGDARDRSRRDGSAGAAAIDGVEGGTTGVAAPAGDGLIDYYI